MLVRLNIRNVALIESAEIELGEGLNVLSGETGSGKSVILDSINFVLGAKADRSMIRNGAADCSVTAVFRVPPESRALDELRAMDIDAEEELDDQVKDDLEDEIEKRAFDGVLNKKGRRLLVEAVPAHKQSERPTFLQ